MQLHDENNAYILAQPSSLVVKARLKTNTRAVERKFMSDVSKFVWQATWLLVILHQNGQDSEGVAPSGKLLRAP
jgi:hypothetical protein